MTILPIWFVTNANYDHVRTEIGAPQAAFAHACGFEPKPGRLQLLPNADGSLAGALFGEDVNDPLLPGKLATSLPEGVWRFANAPQRADLARLAFRLGRYQFDRFKTVKRPQVSLAEEDGGADRIAGAIAWGRDLINLPANILTPAAFEQEIVQFAQTVGAQVRVYHGDELTQGFPLIAAVGAGAAEAPRLVDLVWGRADAPSVTLAGKGVIFDSGGLDIKPSTAMELMKKDVGGAATALTLARILIEERRDIRLRVLIPIVENAISAQAMRPGDIYKSRKGLSVEIGNTDCEGRLILADALAFACEEKPDLLIDFATLTGAARVALGADMPPFYTDDEGLAADIAKCSAHTHDPLWRLPLYKPYAAKLDSPNADISNLPSSSFAGSITAALFLRRFAEGTKAWVHFDIYAWNLKARATGPQGGEIQAARALHALLSARTPCV